MRKKFVAISLVMVLSMSALFGCSENNNKEQETTKTTQESTESTGNTGSAVSTTATESEGYDDEDYTRVFVSEKLSSEDGVTTLASTSANTIYLNGSSIKSEVSGTNVDGSTVTITQPGVYILTGTLEDGQIVVDCSEKGTVELVFNNVEITNKTNSPVYIKDAKKTLIVLAENSENTLTDAEDYTYEDAEKEEPSACLFSKDDLVISGGGSLIVNANFNNGIASKDTLKITGGTIQVTAKNNAIKGKDSLMIAGGDFAIQSEGDGLKADNSDDATLGYIDISGGTFVIQAEQDGIQASSSVNITGGEFDITTVDGAGEVKTSGGMDFQKGWDMDSANSSNSDSEDSISTKGIKAETAVQISDGTFTIDSEDDAIHSNGTVTINGGTYTIETGDDGIHGDDTLTIEDGTITITQSYEGIESPEIIVNGGNMHVTSSDDGFNAAGGEVTQTNTSSGNQRMGMMLDSTGTLTINDGYIYVNADGDGLDSNGALTINGGTVIVEGPTSDGNTAVDYDGTFNINGGVLLASGSAGMVESVGNSSEQNSVTAYFGSTLSAGTTFAIMDTDGNLIVAFTPTKASACFVYSSPLLKTGESYSVMTGGSCSGEAEDGMYTDGNYSGGTQVQEFTVSSVVTTAGSGGTMKGGMGGNPGGGQGGARGNQGNIPAEGETPPEAPDGNGFGGEKQNQSNSSVS